ncbi:S8 family peptidase [Gemmata sp.]|uniref:S8 family peptidase n=1 Tax=Gemmata sp. TaxID=1914242 RepID=UPI003F71ADF9
MARDNLDHIRLARLEVAPQFKPGQPGRSGLRLRPDPLGHTNRLLDEAAATVNVTTLNRPPGVSPDRLFVLRMRFLEDAQRDLLTRFGVVVNEREDRRPIDPAYYELLVEFEEDWHRVAFTNQWCQGKWGVHAIDLARASDGNPDERRYLLRFLDLPSAKAFEAKGSAGCHVPHKIIVKHKKVSYAVTSVVSVQFLDTAALDRFLGELRDRRNGSHDQGTLTAIQRATLFDALDRIERPGPEERQGERLRTTGAPSAAVFPVDVDLWHPGSSQLVREAIEQFRNLVAVAGGTIVGPVRPVMQTLLIARVVGGARTLDALLNYDRVARVDLPPVLAPFRFASADTRPARVDPHAIPTDGPLACVVDSGVVAGHPLLRDLVVDEEDFRSGEEGPADQVGHGTHVAGIVVYGDIASLLQSDRPWEPKVRVVSAKVLRRVAGGFDGEDVRPGFSAGERAESQIEDAVRRFALDPDRKCRVFNLSIGNAALCLGRGHQLPWALLLDELARELDIVVVVSAGNVGCPNVPTVPGRDEFRAAVREQLFSDEHALIDPASAMTALTVGAVSRRGSFTTPDTEWGDMVASPADCPAPITRTGTLAPNGAGPARAVKPELVWFGGNLSLMSNGAWHDKHPELGEPSLNHDFTSRWLTTANGTSVAAPFVTHVCSLVEERMRRLLNASPSANLIRALAVNSARVPKAAEEWLGGDLTEAQANRRRLRAVGYGMPDPYRACYSDNHRAVMFAEDRVAERHFHLYHFTIPPAFVSGRGVRLIRATVAHDPPVRGTRLEYLSRSLTIQLYRGVSTEQIRRALSEAGGDASAVKLPERASRFESQLYEWSTVQSVECCSNARTSFECFDDHEAARGTWHVLVGCKPRFGTEYSTSPQRYALVLSIEHSDEKVEVYLPLRLQVEERARVRPRT